MQEIELNSPRIISLDIEHHDDVSRKKEYKILLNKAYLELSEPKPWTLEPKGQLYTHDLMLKTEAILECSAERLVHIYTDSSMVTRSLWDDTLVSMERRETFDDIHVIQKVVKGPFGKNVHFLGIQWHKYDNTKRMYTVLFTTCTHPFHHCPDGTVETTLVKIKVLSPVSCFVSIVTRTGTKQMLRHYVKHNRLLLYERVCNHQYEEIYNVWKCATCSNVNAPYLLECKHCHVARYWKCLLTGCRQSQPDNKTVNICRYCKGDNSELL